MDVRQEYVSIINKVATGSAEFSKAEQETLAVIAYKQPVKQSVIIKIRGNKAYDHIKHFIDIGLVKAKKAGHTKELNPQSPAQCRAHQEALFAIPFPDTP